MNSFKIAKAALLALILGSPALLAGNGPGSVRVNRGRDDADAYVFVQGNHWTSTNISFAEMRQLRRLGSGDFLWFRRAARTYVIQDKTLLLQAKSCFAPLRALDPERAEIHRRERALDRKEQDFDREDEDLDQIRDSLDGDDEDGEEEPRLVSDSELRDLERRSRELDSRKPALREEQREIEALERAFDRKEDELEKKAETELWKLIDQALAKGIAVPFAK